MDIPLRSIRRGRVYSYEIDGRPVIVFWAKDRIVVASEICPHIGGPLAEATLVDEGCALRCPWHGYLFDSTTGELLENPNEPYIQKRVHTSYETYRPSAPGFKLRLLPYSIENGMLHL